MADQETMCTDIYRRATAARQRIQRHLRRTPLEPSPDLSRENGGAVFLKLENIQHTGSFKVRGALSRLTALNADERRAGILTASSGNHGLAVAFGMRRLGIDGAVYLPEGASPLKVEMLNAMGARIRMYGSDCDVAESFAREKAAAIGQVYISPYNDPDVIGGQGTLGLELIDQLPDVDCVMASVGGGGLIAGLAGVLKRCRPAVRIVGCLPECSAAMAHSVRTGRIVSIDGRSTVSDGTAGGIEPGAITFDLCRELVDEWVLVAEDEIRSAMRRVFDAHRLVIEGAAGVTVAGYLKLAGQLAGQRVVLVVCGGNIDVELFRSIICRR
jgi:threonine dehydratase